MGVSQASSLFNYNPFLGRASPGLGDEALAWRANVCFQYAYPEFTKLATYILGSKICNSIESSTQ